MPQLMVQQPPPSTAHRGDGERYVVRADEKLTAFLELESAIRNKQSRWHRHC